jgi:regulator of nucleoside diphosphate kinase
MWERSLKGDGALMRLLRHKLSTATILAPGDTGPRAAAIGDRIGYRLDEGPTEIRVLVRDEESTSSGTTLSIVTLRGLALLGLMEGDSITIDGAEGRSETLHLERLYDRPDMASGKRAGRRPAPDGPVAASVIDLASRRQAAPPARRHRPDDDPDPSAA